MWFLFALIAGIFFALTSLLIRSYAKKNADAWLLSFYFSLFSAIILIPFFIYEFQFPLTIHFFGGVVLVSVFIILYNFLTFKAAQFLSASVNSTLSKFRLLWILLAGVFIFGEHIVAKNILGMVLIIVSFLLIIDFKNWTSSRKGVIFVVLGTFVYSISAIILKQLALLSGTLSLTFFIFALPVIINALVIPNFFDRAKKEFFNWKMLLGIAIVAVIGNLALVKALTYNALSGVYFVMSASLVLVLVGEYIFLKEQDRLIWKLVAVILAIVGTILIQSV